MKEQQNAGGVAAGNQRPLARHLVNIDRIQLDIISHGPESTDLLQTLTPCCPTDRSRLRAQQGVNVTAQGLGACATHWWGARAVAHLLIGQ